MKQNQMEHSEPRSVDLQKAVSAIFGKAWMIVLGSILCAVLTVVCTFFFVTPKYESSALFYVNNNAVSLGDATLSIDSGDISASKSLVNSYIVILNTRESINEVIAYAGVDKTFEQVKEMITAESVNGTEIFEVVVTSPDPNEAETLANAIANVLPDRIAGIIEGTSAKVVDSAVMPSKPSSPSYTINAIVGFLIGFVLSVGVILLKEIFETAIRTDEDIAEVCPYPVLAEVPNMLAVPKDVYGYDRQKTKTKANPAKRPALIGKDISFVAAEAYKLLRTKLQFSFSDDRSCRVIGISSAFSGEGKSLTAANLAYTLAQLGKNVILIDCDMRRPTLAEKLKLAKQPGLSSFLTGQAQINELIQVCGFQKDETVFHVVAAGQNPPNPVELLSSVRMDSLLEILQANYDYVILDLPPVGDVSDAMTVAKKSDGILLVVRQDACDRRALADAVRQFEFVEARILGVVYNGVKDEGGKGYYKKYYKRNYGGYGKEN